MKSLITFYDINNDNTMYFTVHKSCPSADRLNAWWQDAYLHSLNRLVPAVFYHEARTSLAINDTTPTALIHGMHHRRITLRQDQRISEWQGPRSRNE